MAISKNFWLSIKAWFSPKQLEPKKDFAEELVASLKERISELKQEVSQLKEVNHKQAARIEDLRFKLEQVPRMTTKPSATSIYEFSPESINDQPVFSAEGDQKQIQAFDQQANSVPDWLKEEVEEIAAEQDVQSKS